MIPKHISNGHVSVKRLLCGDETLLCQVIHNIKYPDGSVVLTQSDAAAVLSNNCLYLMVALENQTPIGFAVGYRLPRIDRNQDMLNFYEIEIRQDRRGLGIGKELVAALKDLCRSEGIMKMWVDTNVSNAAAVGLYRSTGAKSVSQDPIQFGWMF